MTLSEPPSTDANNVWLMKDGETVMVVDAGGGTVDITTYTFVTASPILMEEVAPPACKSSFVKLRYILILFKVF